MSKTPKHRDTIRKRRQAKMRRRRLLFYALLLIVIGSVAFAVYSRVVLSAKKTTPQLVEYRDVVRGDGYLLFKEKIVFTKANGIAIYNVEEGKKVPKGYSVADINVMNDNSKIKDQLIRIQAAIDFKNDSSGDDRDSGAEREDENVIRNIQRFIRDEDYEKLVSSINTLDLSTKHTVNVSELNELLKLSIPELEERKDELTERIASTNSDYKAPMSGVVSYTFDDFKGQLSMDHDDEIFTPSYLDEVHVADVRRGGSKVSEKKAFFRSIDDTDYKIALPIDDARLLDAHVGETLAVRIGRVNTEASVVRVNTDASGSVAILELRDHLQQLYLPRRQKVTVIKDTLPALKIPKKALVRDKKGNRGVYVSAVRRFVKFVPVDVLTTQDEYAFLSTGDEEHRVTLKSGKTSKTIQLNDEVIVETKKVDPDKIVY
ncbi:MAG: HlyD family efflux transporter periplasmic adaptor subunit [Peptoniphilus sp.]|nr:HlyD family efflux transporter periplasmic adaptor subunit [Peptoniphilus sp.]MDD7363744.1 HlyD family efflux transporter periplasmic adaptor subunit [Bacillota bacterium]MDY6044129.1 HlyD family efflux transporter periplasmic adaptor subunit [Peptoniphilus sp.]